MIPLSDGSAVRIPSMMSEGIESETVTATTSLVVRETEDATKYVTVTDDMITFSSASAGATVNFFTEGTDSLNLTSTGNVSISAYEGFAVRLLGDSVVAEGDVQVGGDLTFDNTGSKIYDNDEEDETAVVTVENSSKPILQLQLKCNQREAQLVVDGNQGNLLVATSNPAANMQVTTNFKTSANVISAPVSLVIPSGAGPFNDVVLPSGSMFVMTSTADTGSYLTGFSGGQEGRRVEILYNGYGVSTAYPLVLRHNDGSSEDANRVICPGGADLTLNPNPTAYVSMLYVAGRWMVLSYSL